MANKNYYIKWGNSYLHPSIKKDKPILEGLLSVTKGKDKRKICRWLRLLEE